MGLKFLQGGQCYERVRSCVFIIVVEMNATDANESSKAQDARMNRH